MQAQMLAPAAALVMWSLLMLLWMALVRFGSFAKLGVNLGSEASRGKRGNDLNGVLPPEVMWKAHNYDHLMEQPTIFYPTVVILALVGPALTDVRLAWLYVLLRVAHSLWQALVNTIPVRFTLFVLSTICLIVLAARALLLTLGASA